MPKSLSIADVCYALEPIKAVWPDAHIGVEWESTACAFKVTVYITRGTYSVYAVTEVIPEYATYWLNGLADTLVLRLAIYLMKEKYGNR